jgi:parallel beta-helix repeat protein
VFVSPGSGSNIQNAINANPADTAFCLGAGTFTITAPITPKTGDSFTGAYGAVLDGSKWATSDTTQGAFRAWNQNIDDVTIRNLVIRNMPQRGVSTLYGGPDRWIIDHNEIYGCQAGTHDADWARVTNNYVHHNRQIGIGGFRTTGELIENNEIAYNNTVSNWPGDMGGTKWGNVSNITIRGNYIHDNYRYGIWVDGSLTGNVIENNTVVNNVDAGIFYEVSGAAKIRGNVVTKNTGHGIYISNSEDTEVYQNTVGRSGGNNIALFLDGSRTELYSKLTNNYIHDNIVDASDAVAYSNHVAVAINCARVTDGCAAASDPSNNRFVRNAYALPSTAGKYFYLKGSYKTWSEWQAAGMDGTGSAN